MPSHEHDRAAAPVDVEGPPRLPFPVVAIGASAGGLEAINTFFENMPPDGGMAYVVIQHLPPDRESLVADILAKRTAMPVAQAEDGAQVEVNHVYVIRPGRSLGIREGRLVFGEPLARPGNNHPIDDFFRALAEEQRERAIAIVLSGMGSNGSAGAQMVKTAGGICIAQDPETALFPSMPRHLIDTGYCDAVLRPQEIPAALLSYAGHPYARDVREESASQAREEQQQLREVLSILSSRTRQDFSNYKKPTVLRRIQRRMGLARIVRMSEYVQILRRTPTEVTALADDLLIHVTGFFRDPQAWEVLRERVIVPLVASRDAESSIRAWVAACATGEEAYSLAMLLVDEAERAGKRLDIKVFATDMAERTLHQARSGAYPAGIEPEIPPPLLERFFQKEGALYRVRPDLRERVVIAPQNILADPPFSRLDIVSCRNLLIYLEPEMQRRVLRLLHFGLREGGVLFLGSSETTAGADDLFEPLDKKTRLFRRLGSARPVGVEFSLPRSMQLARGEIGALDGRVITTRPSIAQLTTRALLEHHTPAAVTINRDLRVVFYHGNLERYLTQPRGEPTRDLLAVVRPSARSAVHRAVHRAIAENAPVAVHDAWLEVEPGCRTRLTIVVSPIEEKGGPEHLVVSFQERPELAPDEPGVEPPAASDDEIRRVRADLQTAIEELQTSNEELKASNEEVLSTNEELQSTNEELETSREELQSLNEELSTVNAQLLAKIEEHQAASNDLTSLLTSTDIAVLFLDTRFRIRRFTPPVRELFELIAADVGRPLSDLAAKFADPLLLTDARSVLDKLIPMEREITADAGRWFLRRITPYRTADDRIDGVVLMFVDITANKRAEKALLESEARFRQAFQIDTVGVVFFDLEGRITEANDAFLRMTGYAADDVATARLRLDGLTPPEWLSVTQRAIAELKTTGKTAAYEKQYLRKDGTLGWALFCGRRLGESQGVEFVIDIDSGLRGGDAAGSTMAVAENEAASQLKDEFLATLSHELRTPLSAILMWTKLLEDGVIKTPGKLKEAITAIRTSAEAQRRLVEDLLDVSRITSGKLRLEIRSVDLRAVVRDAVDTVAPAAQARDVSVTANLASEIGLVRGDPDRLRQIVWNLLTNAVKFTASGGRVEVSASRDGDAVEIRVADTGRGIAPEMLPRIFDRFRQAEATRTRSTTGLGLGLNIARQLAGLHGGTITASSPGLGKGATFTVHLELPRVTEPPPENKPQRPARKGKANAVLAGLRVLLVEDDADTRSALTTFLSQSNMKVTEADSAPAALAAFESARPDVLLSDVGLPGEDGYSLIRRIREAEAAKGAPPVPAIALTAFVRERDRKRALAAGFQQHVQKPVDPEELLQALRVASGKE